MFTPEQIQHLAKGRQDEVYFVNNIFAAGLKGFTGGEYVDSTVRFLSQNNKTIRVSARDHFKSFALYAHFMYKLLYEGAVSNIESHYFSFNADLAAYHIGKIKSLISTNPYFNDLHDEKPTAESVLRYTWDKKHYTTLTPHGLIQFKRGIHGDLIFVDDPFQDPENDLNPTVIYKINEIFRSNILDMPKEPDGELHCVGTPQTNDDFFFNKDMTSRFKVRIQPAIKEDGTALWPEWMDLEELNQRRVERTERIFKREYLCTPVQSSKGFFQRDLLQKKIVNPNLINQKVHLQYYPRGKVIAGFDIGKKTHPSHLAVFEIQDNKLVMLHHKFMDGWAYSNGKKFFDPQPTQLEYLKMAVENFKIAELYYDNTRGEFETFDEQGLLPRQMTPIVFTTKARNAMATSLDKVVEKCQMEIINDDRLLDQICAVTNDLKAVQSKLGHGDSFWSLGLAVFSVKELIGMEDMTQPVRQKICTGGTSLFSEGSKIPSGW